MSAGQRSGRGKPGPRPLSGPAEAFRRVRKAHATELAEDYVEAIADTIEAEGECRVKHLAQKFGVTHVTVSKAVARLVEQGLATTERQKPIELTAVGKKLATALGNTLEGRTIATEVMLTENAQRAAFGTVIKSNHR